MDLRAQTKEWVAREKHYTALILKNLAAIERDKLYCDYGYPTLFKYLTKELHYSEAEANVRVGAVKLCGRHRNVAANVAAGTLSLTNAAQANACLNQHEKETGKPASAMTVGKAVSLALNTSTRNAKDKLTSELKLKAPRTEKLTLDERMLGKMDRLRKIYGDISAYELIDTLLEEKLKTPLQPLRRPRSGRMPRATSAPKGSAGAGCGGENIAPKNSRYIPGGVKHKVHKGICVNCQSPRNLHYDHIKEYAKGGTNAPENIQMLCENCNQRKRLRSQF